MKMWDFGFKNSDSALFPVLKRETNALHVLYNNKERMGTVVA